MERFFNSQKCQKKKSGKYSLTHVYDKQKSLWSQFLFTIATNI